MGSFLISCWLLNVQFSILCQWEHLCVVSCVLSSHSRSSLGACELSVAVIMFDMNAILVCNSKLLSCRTPFRLSGRLPFTENDPAKTEARIQAAKFDLSKLYQNVSQSASLFLKKILCSYPWWVKQCFKKYSSGLYGLVLRNLSRPCLGHISSEIKRKTLCSGNKFF